MIISMKINLKKQNRICFLGDSITAHGIWISEVIEYFLQNYKDLEIEFFNCGISGSQGRLVSIKDRLYCDFLNYFPNYAVIMFGTNDVGPYLYNSKDETQERIIQREKRIYEYKDSMESLIELCIKRNITPIICTPTPYDEYNDKNNCWNVDVAFERLSNLTKDIAKKYDLMLIDFRNFFLQHIYEHPINDDRVHPNKYGYHLMAEKFLYDIGAKNELELNKECVLSEKNLKRFEIENILRDIIFVERDFMGWQYNENTYSLDYRKKLLKKRIPEDQQKTNEVFINYMKYVDYKDILAGELLKRTIDMYK